MIAAAYQTRWGLETEFIIGLPFQGNAQSLPGGRLVCAGKRQNGGLIRFPVLLPLRLFLIFWFLRGKGESFQIKLMVGQQGQYSCVKLLALCYRLENRKKWSRGKSLRLLSKALFTCPRPLSAFVVTVKEHGLRRISVPSLYKGTIDRVWIVLKTDILVRKLDHGNSPHKHP